MHDAALAHRCLRFLLQVLEVVELVLPHLLDLLHLEAVFSLLLVDLGPEVAVLNVLVVFLSDQSVCQLLPQALSFAALSVAKGPHQLLLAHVL